MSSWARVGQNGRATVEGAGLGWTEGISDDKFQISDWARLREGGIWVCSKYRMTNCGCGIGLDTGVWVRLGFMGRFRLDGVVVKEVCFAVFLVGFDCCLSGGLFGRGG